MSSNRKGTGHSDPKGLTVKAVVKRAGELQERAHRIGNQDPYRRGKVYYPTTASAYKLFEAKMKDVRLDFADTVVALDQLRDEIAKLNRQMEVAGDEGTKSALEAERNRNRDAADELRGQLEAEAARRAMQWLDERIALEEHEVKEHELEAKRSRQRHKRRTVEALHDRDAARGAKTPGQRIDAALAELSVIAAVKAAPLDTDRVSGSRSDSEPRFPGDPRGRSMYEVIKVVRFVENEVEDARRRRVERERDIA